MRKSLGCLATLWPERQLTAKPLWLKNFDVSLRKNVSSKSLILGDDDLLSAVKVDGVSWRAHYFLPPRKNEKLVNDWSRNKKISPRLIERETE